MHENNVLQACHLPSFGVSLPRGVVKATTTPGEYPTDLSSAPCDGSSQRPYHTRLDGDPAVDGDDAFFRPGLSVCVGSGIHPAVDGEIRAGNVRGLRTGDERHQRGDLINMPIAVERC